MAKQGNRRGLSHADAVALVTVCLLLIFLVPALLARPRERASQVVCGANLARIGEAMFLYANDYAGVLPRPGGPQSVWGPVADWMAPNRCQAYNVNAFTNGGGWASFSSCFYLLVKYYQAPPRLFICKGDVGAKEFRLSDVAPGALPPSAELSDLWDFGPNMTEASQACSYAYHVPFGKYGLTTARDPNLAVAADRNPWISNPWSSRPDANLWDYTRFFMPDLPGYGGSHDRALCGNAVTHWWWGQNVLFLDGRVTFERRAFCGVVSKHIWTQGPDNIYMVTDTVASGSPFGTAPRCSSQPLDEDDSLLLHDNPQGTQ